MCSDHLQCHPTSRREVVAAKDKKLKEPVHSLLKKVKGMVLDITKDAMLSLCMFP
jgi:hypothetical protein